jgi:TPP-dependent pyruvate/acetoin dehydrogenase alpha subunit
VAVRDKLIVEQGDTIIRLKSDLKESVIKTRELRAELSDRAAESVKSEVRLRDVETELSVAQASTDMIATGVLDYGVTPESEK